MSTKICEVISFLEEYAHPSFQEDYDNSGLLIGNKDQVLTNGLICLDLTDAVMKEALKKGANFIITHHPLIFQPIKKITGSTAQEKLIIEAIKHDICVYAMHTNADNILNGVNMAMAKDLELSDVQILRQKEGLLYKLSTFVPLSHADRVRSALFEAGAGEVGNYSKVSFNQQGFGTFKAGQGASPYVGTRDKLHQEEEIKIEVLFVKHLKDKIIKKLLIEHPYEEVAFDILKLEQKHPSVGAGIIGSLSKSMLFFDFLNFVKNKINISTLKYCCKQENKIQKVAICGGSGAFLLEDAIKKGADAFITSEVKHHQFVENTGNLLLIDCGHFETEIKIKKEIFSKVMKNFSNFALSEEEKNPVQYF